MAKAVFGVLFVMFFALFVWEGSSTMHLIYGDAYAESTERNPIFWLIIGVLAALCSALLTWYTVWREKQKEKKDDL